MDIPPIEPTKNEKILSSKKKIDHALEEVRALQDAQIVNQESTTYRVNSIVVSECEEYSRIVRAEIIMNQGGKDHKFVQMIFSDFDGVTMKSIIVK